MNRNVTEALDAGHDYAVAGTAGGRNRYVRIERTGDGTATDFYLYSTRIMRLFPDGSQQVWSGGFNTATTWEALRALGVWVSNLRYVPYVNGHRMTEGMVIAADGTITDGDTLTPERTRRG